MSNGGIIGPKNSIVPYRTSGIYGLSNQYAANKSGVWEKQIVRDGLVLWLEASHPDSYPGSGTAWSDLSDSGNNGTLVDGVVFSSANRGTFVFNGSSGYLVPENPFAIWNKSFTISQWVYFVDDTRGILVGDFLTNNAINTAFEKHTSRRLRLYWDASPDIFTGNNAIDLNVWQYVTVVRDKNTSQVRFYNNDSLVHTYNGALSDKTATVPHRIGADGRTGTTVVDGEIASTQIYEKSLTQEEIAQNFNALRGRYGI